MARDRPDTQGNGHPGDLCGRCRRRPLRDTRPAAQTQRAPSAQETMMKKVKPFAPWLPGKFGQMTRQQLDAESDQYNAEFSATRAKRAANAKPHPKKRGRPAKREGEKALRVLITMTPKLLAAADAVADQ